MTKSPEFKFLALRAFNRPYLWRHTNETTRARYPDAHTVNTSISVDRLLYNTKHTKKKFILQMSVTKYTATFYSNLTVKFSNR